MHGKAPSSLLLLLEGPTLQGVLGGGPQLVMGGLACPGRPGVSHLPLEPARGLGKQGQVD